MHNSASTNTGQRRLVLLVLLVLLGLQVGLAQGAETLLFNESPAYQCYRAAVDELDNDAGLEHCNLAIEKQGLTTEAMAATLSNRGLLHARSGELEAALKDHDRAVRLAPEVASLFINRANAYTLQGKFLPALQDLDYAIGLNDVQVHLAYYNRALIHSRLGNMAAARADAERAVAAVPESERYSSFLESLEDLGGGTASDGSTGEVEGEGQGKNEGAAPAPDAAATDAEGDARRP